MQLAPAVCPFCCSQWRFLCWSAFTGLCPCPWRPCPVTAILGVFELCPAPGRGAALARVEVEVRPLRTLHSAVILVVLVLELELTPVLHVILIVHIHIRVKFLERVFGLGSSVGEFARDDDLAFTLAEQLVLQRAEHLLVRHEFLAAFLRPVAPCSRSAVIFRRAIHVVLV